MALSQITLQCLGGSIPNTLSVLQESEDDFLDLDEYNAFVFRLRGDGRNYIANLRTDNWITGGQSHDVWQAALFTE